MKEKKLFQGTTLKFNRAFEPKVLVMMRQLRYSVKRNTEKSVHKFYRKCFEFVRNFKTDLFYSPQLQNGGCRDLCAVQSPANCDLLNIEQLITQI